MTAAASTANGLDLSSPLVIGFGIANRAAARALVDHGHQPVVIEDRPTDDHRAAAAELGVRLVEAPDEATLTELVAGASILLPSPGVPDHHPAFSAADVAGVPVASEFDLAQRWDDRPVAAITGTNGKTTVTMMVADALKNSGIAAEPVGNTDVPFVESITDNTTEVFVVEASSFRLAHSASFRPTIAAWLNFAPDHLDAHKTLQDYERAKATIWANLTAGATVVANADDPVVVSHLPIGQRGDAPGDLTVESFSLHGQVRSDTAWFVADVDGARSLVGPDGPFIAAAELKRQQPHDLANALAAAAITMASGGSFDGVRRTLRTFEGLPHRLEPLGSWDGVDWYNDSKATVPQATVAAVSGFDSVVLIAGGYDKGLSFEPLRSTVPPVRAVVAIGDSADKVEEVFHSQVPVRRGRSMEEAIAEARAAAEPGDAVLLSPACASFDWYPNYVERGLDFSALVRAGMGTS